MVTKEEEKEEDIDTNSLRMYTLNTGLMPRLPFMESSVVNGGFLGPNAERAARIADHIINMHEKVPLDAIHLQEVFDPAAERILIDKLKGIFPHIVSRIGASSALKPSVSSGLVSLYRHEVTFTRFVRYENEMVGHETLANKGAMVVKIKKGDNVYLCYNTHLHGGPGIFKKIAEWWAGNTRVRRSKQLGKLHAVLKEAAKDSAGGQVNYVIGSGDFNLHAENQRKKESKSSGQSDLVAKGEMMEVEYEAKLPRWKQEHPRQDAVKFEEYKKFTDSQNIGYLDEEKSYRREPINFYYQEYKEYKKSISCTFARIPSFNENGFNYSSIKSDVEYVFCDKGLFYLNKNKKTCIKIERDLKGLETLDFLREEKKSEGERINLTEDNLKQFTLITRHTPYNKKDFVEYRNQQAAELKKISGTTLSETECKRIKNQAAAKKDKAEVERTGVINEGQLFDHIYAGEVCQLSATEYKPGDGELELRQVIVQPEDGSLSDHLGVVGFFAIGKKSKEKAAELSLVLSREEPASASAASIHASTYTSFSTM